MGAQHMPFSRLTSTVALLPLPRPCLQQQQAQLLQEKRKQEEERLLASLQLPMGYHKGRPLAALVIFRCGAPPVHASCAMSASLERTGWMSRHSTLTPGPPCPPLQVLPAVACLPGRPHVHL